MKRCLVCDLAEPAAARPTCAACGSADWSPATTPAPAPADAAPADPEPHAPKKRGNR